MDEAAHADPLGGLHHPLRAANVDRLERPAAGLARNRGQVNDGIGACQRGIGMAAGDVRRARLNRVGPLWQTAAAARDGDDLVAAIDQVGNQVASDEPAQARYDRSSGRGSTPKWRSNASSSVEFGRCSDAI